MSLTEAIINKIKVLIYENKQDEAEAVLIAEAGLSPAEASDYIVRLSGSLPKALSGNNKTRSTKIPAFIVLGIGLIILLAIFFMFKKRKK